MQVTDPNAIRTLKHDAYPDAEFDVRVGISREKRSALTKAALDIQPKEGEQPDLEKAQKFYERVLKELLAGFRGVQDVDGTELSVPVNDALLRKFNEVRIPGFDNLTAWLGNNAYLALVLGEQEKKTSEPSLSSPITQSTEAV